MASSLNRGIARFYDRSSDLWEKQWGIHMHQGYYEQGGHLNRNEAQVRMIDELIRFATLKDPKDILDAGCGIGGSSFHLCKKWPAAQSYGLTLSYRQALRAMQLSQKMALDKSCRFLKADFLQPPLKDQLFDAVWSLESAEHVPDKAAMFAQFSRLLRPGGIVACGTWCHREGDALNPQEEELLQKINRHFHLPEWVSGSTLANAARQAGFNNVHWEDWSEYVAPFWTELWRVLLNPQKIIATLLSGREPLLGALTVRHMRAGYKRGLIRFIVLRGEK